MPTADCRLYKTGDLARYHADGQLEYVGRADSQLKLRGVRVELGGLEARLRAQAGVAQAVVLAPLAPDGSRHLVAYVEPLPGAMLSEQGLAAALLKELPAAQALTHILLRETLPRTPHGKLDRQALAHLPLPEPPESEEQEPASELEEQVAAVWRAVLGRERINRHSSFFALGGHSLLATQVVARLRTQFGVELPLRALFDAPTVAGLALLIESLLLDQIEALPDDKAPALIE